MMKFSHIRGQLTLGHLIALLIGPLRSSTVHAESLQPRGTIAINIKLSDDGFGYSGEAFKLYDVEDTLEAALADTAVLDGHEIGGGYFVSFFTSSSLDKTLEKLYPAIAKYEFNDGSFLTIEHLDKTSEKIELPLVGDLRP